MVGVRVGPDVSVDWTVPASLGTFAPTTGSSSVFTAVNVGVEIVTADHATLTDDEII